MDCNVTPHLGHEKSLQSFHIQTNSSFLDLLSWKELIKWIFTICSNLSWDWLIKENINRSVTTVLYKNVFLVLS